MPQMPSSGCVDIDVGSSDIKDFVAFRYLIANATVTETVSGKCVVVVVVYFGNNTSYNIITNNILWHNFQGSH